MLTVIEGTRNEAAAVMIERALKHLEELIMLYADSLDADTVAHQLRNLWFLCAVHVGPMGRPPWRLPNPKSKTQNPKSPPAALPPVILGPGGDYRRGWPAESCPDDMIAHLDERA